MAAPVRYSVLGPVRAWSGETELRLGPPKQQALLALLLVRVAGPLPVHEAVDVLWGDNPPDSAVNVVHRHIGNLRRLLEPDLPGRSEAQQLIRAAGGYRLAADAYTLDLLRFRELRAGAQLALAEGEREKGARLLVESLRLWHGPVASGSPPHVLGHPVFVAVENEYVAAAKEAADAVPSHLSPLVEEVLTILRRAADRRPMDEALQARIITALAVTGRQAEALELFETVRIGLAEELGVDPSHELRAAQEDVLRQTAGSRDGDPDPADPHDDAFPAVRPAQLPADVTSFAGRQPELARSHALLDQEQEGKPRVVIGAISGMPGVGKTTLAVHWAHTVADRYPDGQIYVNLRGFHPAMPPISPCEAMRDVLDTLGVPTNRLPESSDALTSLYRSQFAGRRFLILLDNVRDSDQVRPLLPAAAGCLAIITSRHRLDALIVADNARFIPLGLLTVSEGVELLIRRLGSERVTAEPVAAQDIVDLCGRLPLTLAIASARAVLHPTFSLASIAEELRESQGGLDAFSSGDNHTDARSVFSWSYQALSPAAARLFRLLSLHPSADIAAPAAASLTGVPPREVRAHITELVEHHLLTEHMPGRFTSHDLLRAYAAELCGEQDTAEDRSAARLRLFEHYLHSADRAEALLRPHRERVPLPPALPGVFPQDFTGPPQAADWMQRERQVLLAAVERAAQDGEGSSPHCWQLAQILEAFLDRSGRWEDQHRIQSAALAAARRAGDQRGQAYALRALGFASCRLGRQEEALRQMEQALRLMRAAGDDLGQGRAHRYLAFRANSVKDHALAIDHYRTAAECYAAVGHRSGQAAILNETGWTHLLLGAYEYALAQCEQSAALHRELGDRSGEAAAWDSVGYAQYHLGRNTEALTSYGHALALYRDIKDRGMEADTLAHMGDSHHAAGDAPAAKECWSRALVLYESLDHPDAAGIRQRLAERWVLVVPGR